MNMLLKIKKLCSKIYALGLIEPDYFRKRSLSELATIYNGAGPDWMSTISRSVLTFLLRFFATAFLIHDVEFHENKNRLDTPENRAEFHRANKRMWKNIKILVAANFAWYNPRRWYWRTKGWLAYRACQKWGWSAWIAVGSEQNQVVMQAKKISIGRNG